MMLVEEIRAPRSLFLHTVSALAIVAAGVLVIAAPEARAQVVCATLSPPNGAGAVAGVASTACGPGADASGNQSSAYGASSQATGELSVAIGTHTWSPEGTDIAGARGEAAVAMGYQATAQGDDSTAVGRRSWATMDDSSAFGAGAWATATGAVAVGHDAQAGGSNSSAFGAGAWATATGAVAVGHGALASGSNSSAFGTDATASASRAIAIGVDSAASELNSIAVGFRSEGTGVQSAAFGAFSVAAGDRASAFGSDSEATAYYSSAFGIGSRATGQYSLALGAMARSEADGAVALGRGSVADIANTISVGSAGSERRIVNVAAGTLASGSTDAVNAGQLFTIDQNVTALDGRVTLNENDIATLQGQVTSGSIGLVQQAGAGDPVTVAAATGGNLVDFTGTDGGRVLAGVVDGNVSAGSSQAVTGGQLFATNQSVAVNAADISANSLAIAANDSAIGANSSAVTALDGRVTLNENDIATLQGQVTSGSIGLVQQAGAGDPVTVAAATGGNLVDLTGTDGTRTLTGISNGDLSAGSSEAVTGGQLFTTNQNVATNASSILSNSSAISTLDGRVTTNENDITALQNQVAQGATGLVQQAGANDPVTVAAGTGGTQVNFTGADGARVLAGVADGDVSAGSSQAVTGAQLFATNQNVAANSSAITTLDDRTAQTETRLAVANQRIADAFGGGSAVGPDGVFTQPTYAVQGGTYNAVGGALTALDSGITANTANIAILLASPGGSSPYLAVNGSGASASATGSNAIAAGSGASATGENALALGTNSMASEGGSVAIGDSASSTGEDAIAIGSGASATGSVAVGSGATASNGGAAYGDNSVATGTNSTAAGPGARATAANASAIGSGSVADEANTVSVGSARNRRRVTNMADGVAPSDAATVGQLNSAMSGLAGEIGETRQEARQGIAAAIAMGTAPMPSAPGRTSWVMNTGFFRGEVAFGGAMAHRFDTNNPLALTGGYAYGGGDSHALRVGLQGEF